MSCNKCFNCIDINKFEINALKINTCNGFEVEDIPNQFKKSDCGGIVCKSDNKSNGCFCVNTCNQGDFHRLNNCIDRDDKDMMRKAKYYRRQYIASKLPVNQPKYCDLSIIHRLNNHDYKPVSEMYTYSNDKTDSSTSHTWLVILIVLLVIILVIGLVVLFNRKNLSKVF